MNKKLMIFIFICIILILCKYYFSNYNLEYKVKDFTIKEIYSKNRFYYEIKDKENRIYDFDYYKKRSISKTFITKIDEIKDDNFYCIYPHIKDVDTYPLCYMNNEFIDYNLIETDKLDIYKEEKLNFEPKNKDFVYNNNLREDEYIALWNYKGYVLMNGKNYEFINIFDKDHYDNSLSILLNNKIYMADYNAEYEYKKIYTLDLTTKEVDSFELENTIIDFDSYFVGHVDKYLYLFDNKKSVLYEINTKNQEIKVKGNNELGFVKYDGKEFVSCSKTEYKVNKIKYNFDKSIYKYETKDNKIYKTIKNNKQVISLQPINIVKENLNEIYYYFEDTFYKYNPKDGSTPIFYNYELKFNDENVMFIYNK